MKNQNINTVSGNAEFINLKEVKNPFYQPMAGKVNLSTENKTAVKDENKKDETEGPKSIVAVVQAGPQKAENVEVKAIAEKPAMNLERTLKLVEELHRRMVQRGRLVHTIDNLDKFEIEQKEEAEDTMTNYYQGCEIEITDDKRNKFSTKNPVIIRAVAMFVRDLCTNRLAEIEAEITIPS